MNYTQLTFLRYGDTSSRWWAFRQMREAHTHLRSAPGLQFYKMLGSGAGLGFSPWPDFSTYVLLGVWDSEAAAHRFWAQAPYARTVLQHTAGHYHFALRCFQAKGSWQGGQPFDLQEPPAANESMAVLTRARIRAKSLWPFWRAVPRVAKSLQGSEGLLFHKGVGEWPLIEQATFSLWQEPKAMSRFAYRQKEHGAVVQRTHREQWYSEELFARFAISAHGGRWTDNSFANLPLTKEDTPSTALHG